MSDIYLQAIRSKLRFSSEKVYPGVNQTMLTLEHLMDIPLDNEAGTSINGLYVETEAKLKESQVSGLVNKPTKVNEELALKLAILRDIFEIRTAERDLQKSAKAKAEKRQKIIDAIADAENEEFKGMKPSELRKMLDDL